MNHPMITVDELQTELITKKDSLSAFRIADGNTSSQTGKKVKMDTYMNNSLYKLYHTCLQMSSGFIQRIRLYYDNLLTRYKVVGSFTFLLTGYGKLHATLIV